MLVKTFVAISASQVVNDSHRKRCPDLLQFLADRACTEYTSSKMRKDLKRSDESVCVRGACFLWSQKKYYHFHLLPTKILHPRILQLFEFIQDVNKRTTEGCRGINYFAKVIWDIQYVGLSYSFRKHRHALCELSRVMFHKTKYCHCQRSFTNASNCGPWLHWLSWCLSSWVAVYDEVPVWVCIDGWIREFSFFRTNM